MEVDCGDRGIVAVRRAVANSEDAAKVAKFGYEAFIATFVTEFAIPYPESDLKTYMEESYSTEKFESWIADPKYDLWVANAADGTVVGYSASGPCTLPHPDVTESNGELYKLYIDPSYFRTGLAQALYDRADEFLSTTYSGSKFLSVWSENLRAQKFYQKQGYSFLAEYEYPVGTQRDREFIYCQAPRA